MVIFSKHHLTCDNDLTTKLKTNFTIIKINIKNYLFTHEMYDSYVQYRKTFECMKSCHNR